MHFGCVELVAQHGSTRSSRRARNVECVVPCRDVTCQVEFGLYHAVAIARASRPNGNVLVDDATVQVTRLDREENTRRQVHGIRTQLNQQINTKQVS